MTELERIENEYHELFRKQREYLNKLSNDNLSPESVTAILGFMQLLYKQANIIWEHQEIIEKLLERK